VERLVPHNRYDVAPTYYIFGGLVFVPLSLNYLKGFGREGDWFVRAPTELLDLFYNGEPAPEREEVVLLAKVLADEVNVGYHGFVNGVVKRVNGRQIGSTAELAAAFEEHSGRYHTIEDIRGYRLVLDGEEAAASGERILTRYHIGADRSADLR
jgi:hypothetical protein